MGFSFNPVNPDEEVAKVKKPETDRSKIDKVMNDKNLFEEYIYDPHIAPVLAGIREPALEALNSLEHGITGNGKWTDEEVIRNRNVQDQSEYGAATAGKVLGGAMAGGAGMQALMRMAPNLFKGGIPSLMAGDALSEFFQVDDDRLGDQGLLDRGKNAAISAAVTGGVGKTIDSLSKAGEAGFKKPDIELSPNAQKLKDRGVELTSRTVKGNAPLYENLPESGVDSALRGVRSKAPPSVGGAAEVGRSFIASKPSRIQKLNSSPVSETADTKVIEQFNKEAFERAIPDIDGAAERVGEFTGVDSTFKRLADEYSAGYKSAFEDEIVSETTQETFKRMGKTFKKILKDKVFSDDEAAVMAKLSETVKKVGKGGEENLPKLYTMLKDMQRSSSSEEVRDYVKIVLDNIRSDMSEEAADLLRRLDTSYGNFKALEAGKGNTKTHDLMSHSDLAGGARSADLTSTDNLYKDLLEDWSPIAGVRPRATYQELSPLSNKYRSELLNRKTKFDKATKLHPKFDLDRYISEEQKKLAKRGAMGLEDAFGGD